LNKYETGSALLIFVKFMRQKVPAYLLTYMRQEVHVCQFFTMAPGNPGYSIFITTQMFV
jgi:hypothetical protein